MYPPPNKSKPPVKKFPIKKILAGGFLTVLVLVGVILVSKKNRADADAINQPAQVAAPAQVTPVVPIIPPLDTAAYDAKMLALANNPAPKPTPASSTSTAATASTSTSTVASATILKTLWPVKTVYPNAGALLPFNRIVAFYGNFYSKGMGILGQYPTDIMIAKLNAVVAQWQAADPSTPVIPAIDYIAASAQKDPEPNGTHVLRMPADQIQKAIDLANQVHGIVFLDLQIGESSVTNEVNVIAPYLKLPNVELALDPEFDMKTGATPGTIIGTMDASEINQAAQILAQIVTANNLPPKILVVHRFTNDMVTNSQDIEPLPQVQIVMDMDGWGTPAHKIKTYHDTIYEYPVQFTGFKLFYKNDLQKPDMRMMTPQEILKLQPIPSYIQYQ